MLKSAGKFLVGLYFMEVAVFTLLCFIAVVKGIFISWSGHGLFDCLFYSIGPVLIPMFLLIVHSVFCFSLPDFFKFLSTFLVMPFIIVFTATVTIPAAGYIPPKSFSELSEVEKVESLKNDVRITWEKAQANPNGPHVEMVRNWEMWNHKPDGSNRKYESQIAEYEDKKNDIIRKKQQEERNESNRLKILYWFLPK